MACREAWSAMELSSSKEIAHGRAVACCRTDRGSDQAFRNDYGRGPSRPARLRAGEVFGFLGPNGAGKSTTVRLLLGLLRATSGRALIFGTDAADAVAAHRHLAYVPADVALWPNLTGAETLALLGNLGSVRTDRAYQAELVERFDLQVNRRCGTYSTGNRQKVALIAAFATRAPLLVLDEPTSGLDPADGAGVPDLSARGGGPRADGLPQLPPPGRGRGGLRPGRHPAGRPAGGGGRSRRAAAAAGHRGDGDFSGPLPDAKELTGLPGVQAVDQESPTR